MQISGPRAWSTVSLIILRRIYCNSVQAAGMQIFGTTPHTLRILNIFTAGGTFNFPSAIDSPLIQLYISVTTKKNSVARPVSDEVGQNSIGKSVARPVSHEEGENKVFCRLCLN